MGKISKKAFAAFVKEHRLKQGLTQEALAARLNVSSEVVSKWERGIRFPNFEILEDVADALGVKWTPYYVASSFLDAASAYDFNGSLIGDKANSVVFDNSKLKRAVPDFVATVRFDQGVKMAVDYVLAHPEYQQEDPEFDVWCDRVMEALEQAKAAIFTK